MLLTIMMIILKARSFARDRDWENIFDKLEDFYYEAKELKYTSAF